MFSPHLTANQLRREINARAEAYAQKHRLLHDLSPGPSPSVIFGLDALGFHGNFHPASYNRIVANPEWARRLSKPHTASRRSAARKDWRWMELDSATSSDALLMNIFCHPDVSDDGGVNAPMAALLGVDRNVQPRFGATPGVPLGTALKPRSKRAAPLAAFDRTEVDLVLAGPTTTLFLEAKLTESDFQTASPALLSRYRDLEAVFDIERLPRTNPTAAYALPAEAWGGSLPAGMEPVDPDIPAGFFETAKPTPSQNAGYQLIRNVLAAHAADAGFCVLLDARRRDLIDAWYAVISAVRSVSFATRLRVLAWQDLLRALPRDLQSFLAEKYGIT